MRARALNGALAGKRVLVARAAEQAGSAADLLRARGAEPVVAPAIAIHDPSDPEPMRRAVREIASYGWVAFTSANGVERAVREAERQGVGAKAFGGVALGVIGKKTAAALAAHGLSPRVVADEQRGEGLAAAMLAAFGDARPRVLVARAKDAREVLPDTLRAAGCAVDVVAFYETRPPDDAARDKLAALFAERAVDAVLLTSASTVENLALALGDAAPRLLAGAVVASIGPVTSDAAAARGVRVDVTAPTPTLAALIDALEGAIEAAATRANLD